MTSAVDARLVEALREQLRRRPRDAGRVGWKVGAGERERIGGSIAVGHLTSATLLQPGATYCDGGGDLRADAELAVEIGGNATIAGYGAALELVDLAGTDGAEAVVAANVFHRAVAFGPIRKDLPRDVDGAIVVNGERQARAPARVRAAELVDAVARVLAAVGERLEAGDRVITGSIVQVPVASGDDVVADLASLGRVGLAIA